MRRLCVCCTMLLEKSCMLTAEKLGKSCKSATEGLEKVGSLNTQCTPTLSAKLFLKHQLICSLCILSALCTFRRLIIDNQAFGACNQAQKVHTLPSTLACTCLHWRCIVCAADRQDLLLCDVVGNARQKIHSDGVQQRPPVIVAAACYGQDMRAARERRCKCRNSAGCSASKCRQWCKQVQAVVQASAGNSASKCRQQCKQVQAVVQTKCKCIYTA